MSALDDTDRKVLAFYRERIPLLEVENERLRKLVVALQNEVSALRRWDGRERRRGTSVPPRTRTPGGSE